MVLHYPFEGGDGKLEYQRCALEFYSKKQMIRQDLNHDYLHKRAAHSIIIFK